MKRLILLLAVLPSPLLSTAMPTDREIAEVKPLVAELMKLDTCGMKAVMSFMLGVLRIRP